MSIVPTHLQNSLTKQNNNDSDDTLYLIVTDLNI